MNKTIKTVAGAAIMCALLAGCGKDASPQELIGAAKTNMDAAKSVDFDLHISSSINVEYEGTKISQSMELSLNVQEDIEKGIAHMTGTASTDVNGTDASYGIDAYQTSMNGADSLYYEEDGNWYRMDSEEEAGYGLQLMKMLYDAGLSFSDEKAEVNGQECSVLAASAYGEGAEEYASMLGVGTSEDAKLGIELYIYDELEFPAYAKVSLADAIGAIEDDELDVTVKELTVEMTFNSFNECSVEIPDDVQHGSQKKQEAAGQEAVIQDTEQSSPQQEQEEQDQEDEEESEREINITLQGDDEEDEKIETLRIEWNSFQFEYDGTIYRVPMQYKSFEGSGFQMDESIKVTIMEAGQTYTMNLTNGSYSIIAKLENTTTAPKTLYECDIVSLDFDIYTLDDSQLAMLQFPAGVGFAYTYEQITDLWGEPESLHDGAALKIATWQDGDNYVEIYFDPDDGSMIEYKICAK